MAGCTVKRHALDGTLLSDSASPKMSDGFFINIYASITTERPQCQSLKPISRSRNASVSILLYLSRLTDWNGDGWLSRSIQEISIASEKILSGIGQCRPRGM